MTLTADTFTFVARLVRQRSAINLEEGKEYLVESRLLPLARESGVSVDDYVTALRRRADQAEFERIVEALTTNETSWFRDAAPFQALSEHVLPELLEARPRELRIWSAACSSGQEPYSIAMGLAGRVPALTVPVRITATDLSNEVLDRARRGRYSQLEINRGLPAPLLVRHFRREGIEWQIDDALRSMVSFARHNLLDPPPLGGPFDVVFLRNVLIYFDVATKRDVLSRLRAAMRPGGYLFLGAAETTIGVDDGWRRVQLGRTAVYQTPTGRTA